MYKLLALLSMVMLSGCVATQGGMQDYLVTNQHLPTDQKIAYLEQQNPSDGFSSNGPCNTLLECSIYTNDIELAEWLLARWEDQYRMHMIVRDKVYYDDEYYKVRYTINAPIKFGLNDEDAVKFIRLMKQHRIASDVCGYGNLSPITNAYINNYPKTLALLLADHKVTSNGKADLTSTTECKFPIDALKVQYVPSWDSAPGLLEMAMMYYDGSPEKSQMFTTILDNGSDIETVSNHRDTRCYKYSRSSALAYSACENNEKSYKFLTKYYTKTDRLSLDDKQKIFAHAQEVVNNTPSVSDLKKEADEDERIKAQKWNDYRSELAAARSQLEEEVRQNANKKKTAQTTLLSNGENTQAALENEVRNRIHAQNSSSDGTIVITAEKMGVAD
ncbi:hypothetical protein L3V77_10310 [Vibrio sp. DW001]|uniref:hypothetical protein n=1 Tax=Vibrio sp. DW001 TaxID=2912315 RepID=UPI0023B08DCC|nr:hypothetical protein [Vibrio sp. DW001]WED25461.1 hypothetical protein L3V77_10310 [Vibrio sp. DW001]